jgi:CDP-glucose 4,6-dehydratase
MEGVGMTDDVSPSANGPLAERLAPDNGEVISGGKTVVGNVMPAKRAFWSTKRVLVTGHTGFKGSWLALWLQHLGATVIGYALEPPTQPSLFEVAHVGDGMTSIVGDVRDLDHLQAVMAKHRPQIVIHMAAQPLVRRSYHDPVETYSTNIMGTVNVLEAVRQAEHHGSSVRAVVCITSDKCYENKEWLWGYRENDPMGGHDPYSSSKGCAELIISAYRNSFFAPSEQDTRTGLGPQRQRTGFGPPAIASTRAGNVIGGGDWAQDRLIPDMMKAIMEGRPVEIRSPHAVRPWVHVLEPLNGYLMLAEQLWIMGAEFAQAWNFGASSEDAKSVQWIVENLIRLWGEDARWERDLARHPHENRYLKLDNSKTTALLGWRPKLDLITALEWIVEWYRAYHQQNAAGQASGMRALTREQIVRFENLEAEQCVASAGKGPMRGRHQTHSVSFNN